MSRWFRLYSDLLDDPKCQSLGATTFKTWINLLCIASRSEGKIDEDAVAFRLRMKPREARAHIAKLKAAGLLDVVENTLTPHNWESRQWVSDDSKDRVRRYREKQKTKRFGNDDVTVTVTPPDNRLRTDTERKSPAPNGATKSLREKPDTALYRRGKEILGPKLGGKVIKALIANTGELDDVRRKLIRISESADPAAYATAILRGYENPIAADDWIT